MRHPSTRFHRRLHRLLTPLALGCILLYAALPARAAQPDAHIHVSVWYWLNSIPKDKWQSDFKAIKALGCTDVVLVWGMDGAAFSTRTHDSHEAIASANKAGLGSYLFVWHARYNSLPHEPQLSQVDAAGHILFAFDTFNPQWRYTQWKSYLQKLAHEYAHETGLRGYVFDNSFAIGYLGKVDGAAPSKQDAYISYAPFERQAFGNPLPTSPADPSWSAWNAMRQHWWAAWAKDTRDAVRAVDPDLNHQLVLEDGQNTIDADTATRNGLSLGEVTPYFDTMSAYWAPAYSDDSDTRKLAAGVTAYLKQMRTAIGPTKKLALSLRLSDDESEGTPGHAGKPTIEQIRAIIDAALSMGLKRIDLYGYRMGIYHLENPGWEHYLPGSASTYPITGQIEGKFLADRPELWPGLTTYFEKIGASPQH